MLKDFDTLQSLCKRRGFIFQSSEIYGGLGSCWDYGPLGIELKNNIKRLWWQDIVHNREDVVGLESSILMHPNIWRASGHTENFNDPMMDCKNCKARYRADEILNQDFIYYDQFNKRLFTINPKIFGIFGKPLSTVNKAGSAFAFNFIDWNDTMPKDISVTTSQTTNTNECVEVKKFICKRCGAGPLTEPRQFNLMFKTFMGPIEEDAAVVHLRPETAQGMFVNFVNVHNATRKKLPFGIAQIGKSFRNEITPGNFIFRTREFEQMEMEFFVKPGEDEKWYDYWVNERFDWHLRYGIKKENLRIRHHDKEELSHYSKATADIEYKYPIGWSELEGIANRTDFDLRQHEKYSKQDLKYFDQETNSHILPYVIEPAAGVDRKVLAFLSDSYFEETVNNEKRVALKLNYELAPVKFAILPLLKKRDDIVKLAKLLRNDINKIGYSVYDDTAAIGKLYRRQDEIGTPYCITVDVQTIEEDKKVTVRERDSMEQIRVSTDKITEIASELRLKGWKEVSAKTGLWKTNT